MPYTDTSINNLVIHKFPSTTLFNTAVNAGSIAVTDISFVEGANEQRVAANNIVLSASNQAYIYVDGATKTIRLLENYSPENHDHLSITSKGAIKGSPSYGVTTATNDQVAIASGDRLVIGDWSGIGADAGYPLKLSTISFAANGTRFLREDGTWSTPAGGGGGGGSSVYAWDVTLDTATSSFVQIDSTTYTIKLPDNIPSGWIGTASNKAAAGNHTHGDITNSGTITAAAVTATSGDYIVLCDSSNSNKIVKSNIQLGNSTNTYLRNDGSWSNIQSGTTSSAGIVQLTDSTSSTSTTTAATPNSVKTAYDLAAAAIPKGTGTSQGDIIYYTASGSPTRLAKGASGQVLTMNATVPTWTTPSSGGTTVTLPSGYSSSTGITLSSSALTTIATVGGTELKLKVPAGDSGGGTQINWVEWTYN